MREQSGLAAESGGRLFLNSRQGSPDIGSQLSEEFLDEWLRGDIKRSVFGRDVAVRRLLFFGEQVIFGKAYRLSV